jgi:hypothetical protein
VWFGNPSNPENPLNLSNLCRRDFRPVNDDRDAAL